MSDHSTRLAARLWWALLPYAGWTGYHERGEIPPPWYAWPLTWLWQLVGTLPSAAPYKSMPQVVCNCDYCRGVPGAEFEP